MEEIFLSAVEEPAQECCYAIVQLPISNSTQKKEFINTSVECVDWQKVLRN